MKIGTDKIETSALAPDEECPATLFSRLDIEKYLDQLDSVANLSASERRHLDDMLSKNDSGDPTKIDEAGLKTRRDSRQLSEILMANVELTRGEKEAVRKYQQDKSYAAPVSGEFALGTILIANGQITRLQLEQALRQQVETGRRLGEELITAGHSNTGQIEKGLLLQRKLIACALAITVGVAPIVATSAEAAQTSASMAVSVTVVAHAKMLTNFQATQLKISKEDIRRGYIEVSAASRFSVVSNSRSGYLMQFYPVGNLFDSVQVQGLGAPVQMGADGGAIVQRGTLPSNPTVELSFRFALHPDILPGNYPWPLQLSVRAL